MALDAAVIEGFVTSCLLTNFDDPQPTPDCHKEWWELCSGTDRFVAIAAPRGFAKSTAITHCYTLAVTLFRERKFVVLVSDTEGQAVMFLQDIAKELKQNEKLADLFHLKRTPEGDVEFSKDSETDIIVDCADGYQFRIVARGAGQRIRGLKWGHRRPDLIIGDDLENDEIVLNKDRRLKFKQWFNGALKPALADGGMIRVVGTILHMDSFLENLMPGAQLSAFRQTKELVSEPLKEWTNVRLPWKAVKYRAHSKDYKHLLWPSKRGEEELREIRRGYIAQGIPEVYAQEYLNEPLDDTFAYFRRDDFRNRSELDKESKLNYYIALDLAISEDDRADYTVAVIGGLDSNGYLHIVNVIRDRLDGRQIVDLILRLQWHYKPHAFGVEEGQIKKSIWAFLKEEMLKHGNFPNFVMLKPINDKQTRARAIQGRMRAQTVRFDKQADWYQPLEDEMVRFPRDKHDDQVDAMAWLGHILDKMQLAPTLKEEKEEQEEFEFRKSGLSEQGRNMTTGY